MRSTFTWHFRFDLYGCAVDLNDRQLLSGLLASLVEGLDLTPIGETGCAFPSHGLSLVVFLQESHLLVSTWPELGTAQLDLVCCKAELDRARVQRLVCDLFQARYFEGDTKLRDLKTLE